MKRRIGLTQRVDAFPDRDETRDALDQRWAPLLAALGFAPMPLCTAMQNVPDYLDTLSLDGVILTGGNDIELRAAAELPPRDRFEHAVLSYCRERRIPVLGVCRGMQIINIFFNGRLSKIAGHVATRHPILLGGEQRSVNSFHNFAIGCDDLGAGLFPLARCEDGTIEAFCHDNVPWHGIMWHPERETVLHVADVSLMQRLFGS